MIRSLLKDTKNELNYRKILSVILLILCAVFLILEFSNLKYIQSYICGERVPEVPRSTKKYYSKHLKEADKITDVTLLYNLNRPTAGYTEVTGNSTIRQEFRASDSNLQSVQIFFYNPDYYTASGKVEVYITDKNGTEVARSELDAGLIPNRKRSRLDFTRADSSSLNGSGLTMNKGSKYDNSQSSGSGSSSSGSAGDAGSAESEAAADASAVYLENGVLLDRGELYTLNIDCKDIKTPSAFGVYLSASPERDTKFVIDGEEQENALFASVTYYHFTYGVFFFLEAALLLTALLILLPWKRLTGAASSEAAAGSDTGADKPEATDGSGTVSVGSGTGSATASDKAAPARLMDKPTGIIGRLLKDPSLLIQRLFFILTPFICYYMCLKIADVKLVNIIKFTPSMRGVLNILLIVTLWLLVYLISNSLKYTTIITTGFTFLFCMVNFLLIQFRGSPLIITDITSLGTALDVAGNYEIEFNKSSLWVITAAAVMIAPMICVNRRKSLDLKKRLALLCLLAVCVIGVKQTVFTAKFTKRHGIYVSGFHTTLSYRENGYPLSFAVTANTSIMKKPEGYSADRVAEIASGYTSDSASVKASLAAGKPNVIVVMNEAFSDLSVIADFETSAPYIPFFNSLKDNTVKGWLHTSIFGGSTANTEFEFLTGGSMEFFPFHSVPYNTNIRGEVPSLVTTLEEQGYGGSIAFHPGRADSYNRSKVYPNLGFDRHISLEDLKDPGMLRAFVSDESDFETVISEYEAYRSDPANADKPFFLFNVTIQNHSSFSLSTGAVEKELTVTDDEIQFIQTEQYLNLVKKTDEALEGLIGYLEKLDEPTVVVFFGDHQPRVDDDLFTVLQRRASASGELSSTAVHELMYQVPFMIWANYDIPESEGTHISANYLSAYMLDLLGLEMTGYDKYRLETFRKVPVLTSLCYYDAEGNIHDNKDIDTDTSPEADLVREYGMVQYNLLIDTKNRVADFFELAP